MSLDFRFAIVSDPHVALPLTLWEQPNRFHLTEVSIPALEVVLTDLSQQSLDFLLIPGDLTQHGEPENHAWLAQRLAQLPFPVYVIPGNHDLPELHPQAGAIASDQFPSYYRQLGYQHTDQLYYTCELLPGVRLVALNSNQFDATGRQIGAVDQPQLTWLQSVLALADQELVLLMIHHNLIEHLPGQSQHALSRRYMLTNASELLAILQAAGVRLLFTGHLHVQDIAYWQGIYEITTGSLVSYPHPYRIVYVQTLEQKVQIEVQSSRVQCLPAWPDLQHYSREWMGDRSVPFMTQFLTHPPLNLSTAEAENLAPHLRYFWSSIAAGDPAFDFPQFPEPVRSYFEAFSHSDQRWGDNRAQILL